MSSDGTTAPSRVAVSILDEMRTSYLDYAMSVIIGRAIPDVRDGLKPVHRRILYSMFEQNIGPSSAYKKCARVVGDVLGKYHPHGDLAVYDALVRMAQDFSLRVPLVDGQGNFGSVDGDSPAAMRYTECRLAAVAVELLNELDRETVDFIPNYDDSEKEPSVLPAKFPQLLVNGASGIAVGMATNIPPHNLGEIVDATIALIDDPDVGLRELLRLVPGPDFPTGALIYGRAGIEQAYLTGRGSIVVRARTFVEPIPGHEGREQIVITEIPYQCNKARLVGRIAELVKDKRIEGVSEIRDESDREGIRVVIELKKDSFSQVVLNQLFRLSGLQTSFGVINLSIADGRPRVLTLKETLEHFIAHRRETVRRRCRYELRRAEARRELCEGLGMATTDIDRVVATIRAARDPEEARERLMELRLRGLGEFLRRAGRPEDEAVAADARGDYRLTERQARAILEMRLARLTGLEREKLAAEYGELASEIARLTALLGDAKLLMALIKEELGEVRARFAGPRRTEIVAAEAEIQLEDLIQQETVVVAISHLGYVKRTPVSTYRAQRRGGKGRTGMAARDEDWVSQLFVASTHSFVFFFSDRGKVYVKKVYEIPEAPPNARGRAIVNFVGMEEGEKVAAITPVEQFVAGRFVVTLTKRGQIKKTELAEYENYRDKGIIGVRIDDGDELLTAAVTDGECEFLIGTRQGMAIRFSEKEVRPLGRATMGVKAIELGEGDQVVGLGVHQPGSERDGVLAVCEQGYGKQTPLAEFRLQSRGGKGVILIDASERNGPVVGVGMVQDSDELIVITDRGQTLRTTVSGIRETGRNAQGVRVMDVADGERVVALETYAETEATASVGPATDVPGDEGGEPASEAKSGREQHSSGAPDDEAPGGSTSPPVSSDDEPGERE
ncbi:MAG: DNA gyrase subunit A [Polyangiaceae bacterium]|nr:DNA gyrase subunit A [Polyangiaceae bacterium]